jgi:hypothetical protein
VCVVNELSTHDDIVGAAGITNFCSMGLLIAKLSWNRRKFLD